MDNCIFHERKPRIRNFLRKICKYQIFVVSLQKNKTIMEELRNELRDIVNKPATKITKADKAFLSDAAAMAGVDDTVTNTRCGTCWHELAMKIYDAIAEQGEQGEQGEQSGEQPQTEETQNAEQRRYVLKKGVDVIFGKIGRVGVRVNALTMTDELGDKLIAAGFPKKYFEKCE